MSPKTGTIIYKYHNNVALQSSIQLTTDYSNELEKT